MAKSVKKAVEADAGKPKPAPVSEKAAGTGFTKRFTETERKEIEIKRRELRARLFAAG